MATDNNPYAPPEAELADLYGGTDEFQPARIWSASGRLGRMRCVAYVMGGSIVCDAVSKGLHATVDPTLWSVVSSLLGLALIVLVVLTLIQRSHDMGWSGWTCLLGFIPVVNFIWIFKAGTPGENEYGAPPPPNTWGVKFLALLIPAVAAIGILAAVVLPAYQQYMLRAKAAQVR